MGLENGFLVKSNKRKITRDMLPSIIKYPFEDDYNDAPEIIYFRKCWGVRTQLIWCLTPKTEKLASPSTYYAYTSVDVMDVIKCLSSFMDEFVWDEEANSIWTYEEIAPHLLQDIVNLAAIAVYMDENPDVYLEFYDSY